MSCSSCSSSSSCSCSSQYVDRRVAASLSAPALIGGAGLASALSETGAVFVRTSVAFDIAFHGWVTNEQIWSL